MKVNRKFKRKQSFGMLRAYFIDYPHVSVGRWWEDEYKIMLRWGFPLDHRFIWIYQSDRKPKPYEVFALCCLAGVWWPIEWILGITGVILMYGIALIAFFFFALAKITEWMSKQADKIFGSKYV